jgi:hypothetical protein
MARPTTPIQRQSHDMVSLDEYDAAGLSSPTHGVQSCRHLVDTPGSCDAVVPGEDVPCYQSGADYQAQETSRTFGQAAIHQKSAAN